MTPVPTIVDAGVSLAATIVDDATLYRSGQALLALSSAPGRRNLRLSRQHDRWDVYGLSASTTQFAPPTLSLDAGLSHRAHLHALLLAPLAVEMPQFALDSTPRTTYAVQREGLPVLFMAIRTLAAALDSQESAEQGPWWGRRARRAEAAQQLGAALQGLRSAAAQVNLIRMQ
ncbi:hypothetical protein HNQ07_002145 [Deinococcus metalli]|uniref:Uncharacterized protein n=1 Tax=Deinococcus metalli TaxID=1141878 RepID=A0A7W8KGP6_9DEIO|nr:hypothetical protein [Deinococcus metalli]MBB5376681.1 hypothetical protein [Deinococcus metalli]GHF42265.1 hypothetical protein GCM10017781_18190 [Deinococcus metalli]